MKFPLSNEELIRFCEEFRSTTNEEFDEFAKSTPDGLKVLFANQIACTVKKDPVMAFALISPSNHAIEELYTMWCMSLIFGMKLGKKLAETEMLERAFKE